MRRHLLGSVGVALLLSAAPFAATQALAVDSSDSSLEIGLVDEIAARLVNTYSNAASGEGGFETFERLFSAYETLRKWQAYLDAIEAAKLGEVSAPYARLKSAVERLKAESIDGHSLAVAAIDALRGLGDWHADDKAQADLVIEHLGQLVTELSDPRLRVIGQSILADVELDSDAPMAAAARIVAAVPDLRLLEPGTEQLDLAVQLAWLLQRLDAPRTIEVTSEIAASVTDPADRSRFVRTLSGHFSAQAQKRVAAAAANPLAKTDPLALAWAVHMPGGELHAATVALGLGGDVDPLPVVLALADGADANARQMVCATLVDRMAGAGQAIRGLNLRRSLDAGDCSPGTALTLAAAFADAGLPGVALPLVDEFFEQAGDAPDDLQTAAVILERVGDPQRLQSRAEVLQPVLGNGLAAMAGRAVINGLLLDRKRLGSTLTESEQAALAGHAPATYAYALLSGVAVGKLNGMPGDADLALLRRAGKALAELPKSASRLRQFVSSDAPLAARLAAAAGYSGDLGFDAGATPELVAALSALAIEGGAAGNLDGNALLASLGTPAPASLGAAKNRDELLSRAARQRAWSGDMAGATASMSHIGDRAAATALRLDLASIEAVAGDFDTGVAAIRAQDSAADRIAAFRFVARQRAERLDVYGWIDGGKPLDLAPVQLINAATGDGPVIHYDDRLNVRASGAALPTGKPVLPDLDVSSSDVRNRVPLPRGGAAGIVVGGEGRYVRLGGFDSPYFDGESNNGVRDYVYEQNKTITPEFIFLNEGVFTLADVIAAIGRDQADAIDVLPGGVVRLNRPLAVGSEATLILSGEEVREIQLNATTGAFIVNAGHLDIMGVRIVGFDVESNAIPRRGYETAMHKFRPFILSWSGSETNVADSEFVALGYSAGRSYGVTFNSGPVDDYYHRATPAAPTGIMVNNSFDNLYYGFYAYEASDVQLVGNEYRNNIIYGIDPHDRSQRLNISLNTAYGTAKKHGIIISREVNDSFIVGNLSFDNYGSGTMLDRSSVGTLVFANTLRGNHGDGMAVFESPCTIVGMNDISGNNRAGIKVRNSWDVLLLQNTVEGNKGTAIEGFISDLAQSDGSAGRNFVLDPYQPVTGLSAIGNAVRGNGAGIQTAGVSQIELYANQFRYQSGRLVAGDLDGLQGLVLQQAEQQPTMVATNCVPVLQPTHACPFTEAGLIAATRFATSASGNFCTGDAATPQAQAFNMVAQ